MMGKYLAGPRRSKTFSIVAGVWLIVAAALNAFSQIGKSGVSLVPGQIVNVVSAADSAQSCSLYLPSSYTPSKRWPIIYFFDPGGRGEHPVQLYKDIAEKYGFIFAGSNNSRNFSADQAASVNAIWQDTHLRLAIDEHRTYVSGFSGGARVAGAMALNCSQCQIAGVVAHGAGYPSGKPNTKDHLLYYFAVGDRDFNWPEVVTVRREREEQGLPYRVRVYSGTHQWAPADVMEDAMQWFILHSMQSGDVARDAAFVDQGLQRLQAEAEEAEKRTDPVAQLAAYRSLLSDFASLKEVKQFKEKLDLLKKSATLKKALKQEGDQIDQQFALELEISPKLRAYVDGSSPDQTSLRVDILQSMARLKDRSIHEKDEGKRLVYGRAFDDMRVEGIENGQQELESRHFEKAETCFQLMAEVTDGPWPALLLAETHVASGKKKQAISDLRQAVRRGLNDADAIESNRQFDVLQSDPEFQKLVSDLKSNKR
jgi:dienelactone hydrolase